MRVSVIIPNYNYADFIGATIHSVLSQSEKADEIIVVDDGSTDNSRDIISDFGDKVISIFQNNAGQAAAWSAGFAKATGDIICFLDSDDFFHPQKIATLKKLYRDNLEAKWIFHDLQQVEGVSVPVDFLAVKEECPSLRNVDGRKKMAEGKAVYDAPATSGLTFRRDFLMPLFPLPTAESIYISDHYMKFYALAMGAGLHVSENLGGQLIHGANLYTGGKQMATRGKIFVNTATALRAICPQTARFCNSLFAEGRACLNATGEAQSMMAIIQAYQADLSPLELLLIEGKTLIKTRRYRP